MQQQLNRGRGEGASHAGLASVGNDRAPSVVGGVDAMGAQEVQLFLAVRNIPKLDLMSPSDPFIIVSLRDPKTKKWKEVAVTEIVWDNHNVDFVKRITMNYIFEEVQELRFTVLDADTKDANRRTGKARDGATDFIGQVQTTMAELVTRRDSRLEMNLKTRAGAPVTGKDKQPSRIIIRTEEVSQCQDVVMLQLSGRKLPKMDTFGRADPFLQIYRSTEDGRWAAVAKTEYVKRTYNPDWNPMLIKVQQLCNGDYMRPLKFRCFDWNSNAAPDFMGECECSLDAILKGEVKELAFRRRGKKRIYGTLVIRRKKLRQQHSFLEFVRGGLDIQLMTAIDFTASNGDPRDTNSLHFMGRDRRMTRGNDYLKALQAVGTVLEPYDTDGMIPVWGFGAKVNGSETRHCFPLTLDDDNIEVQGVQGMVEAYKRALPNMTLSGPTLLSQVIGTSMALSTTPYDADNQNYTVLLILTDGVINDKQQSTDTIVHCTDYPMSIIICGVGNADFSTMEYLDADEVPLVSSNGNMMKRDIVQFVPFNEFKNAHPIVFAREVLEEIPDQVTSYMAQHDVHPLGWQPRDEDIARARQYNQAPEGHSESTLELGGLQPGAGASQLAGPKRRSSDSDLMDRLGGGAVQDRVYYLKGSDGKTKGLRVNTGHEDDYLYQDKGTACCTVM